MSDFFSIAIDGPGGAGKSSLARRLAADFSFIYVDTGAIYRTVALAVIRAGIDSHDKEAVCRLLPCLDISIRYGENGEQQMHLNGEDVSAQIRSPEISMTASNISAMQEVRSFLMEMQRKFARESNVIMDGRDIGTVVLPNADLKIFLTAAPEKRAMRRWLEMQAKGEDKSFEQVLSELKQRDEQDIKREAAPLKPADDAIVVDTGELDFEQSAAVLSELVMSRLTPERE